jgi:mannose-6-phosphate isomerase-like protein (cupin superfamily)
MSSSIFHRPWGYFEVLAGLSGVPHNLKRLHVNPGSRLSLQSHQKRSEVWSVVQGEALAEIDGTSRRLRYGEIATIPAGVKHRLSNPGDVTLIVVELQTGESFEEEDIIRYEDDHARQ